MEISIKEMVEFQKKLKKSIKEVMFHTGSAENKSLMSAIELFTTINDEFEKLIIKMQKNINKEN
jgi:hypothetical protein